MDLKSLICATGDRLGAFRAGRAALRLTRPRGYIRAVNYHATPASSADNFRRQLEFYRRWFDNATPADLADCLEGRRDPGRRPGLLISFDDGYVSNHAVAAGLLEEFGFTGWFFVSSGRVGDRDAANPSGLVEGERFMTLAEMRDLLARGHVVGCHTHSHPRLSDELGPARLDDEIVAARGRLSEALGRDIDAFCWVGGEEWSYGVEAARRVVAAGYRLAFTTNLSVIAPGSSPMMLDRTNIESDWPMDRVRFYLSGAMDLAYARKRGRVAARLARGARLAAG